MKISKRAFEMLKDPYPHKSCTNEIRIVYHNSVHFRRNNLPSKNNSQFIVKFMRYTSILFNSMAIIGISYSYPGDSDRR